MSIFKACDIRGLAGKELDEALARRLGLALGGLVRERSGQPVCLGGDFRRSTPALKLAVCEGLIEAGATVFDIGQNPTPLAYFAAARLKCPNIGIVTASHNPGRYNGLKFMVAGRPATPELVEQLRARLGLAVPRVRPGHTQAMDMRAAYEAHVREQAAATARSGEACLSRRRLKIVVDPMGGAFAGIAPRIMAEAGCEVVAVSDELDPDFARRDPNPSVDENLKLLSERVVSERADLGLALDGDGDRAAVVDHTGRVIRPEQMGALFLRHCFPKPTVVYDLKCASVLVAEATAAGGVCVMQPSGHGFIKTAMLERQADLGVEVSGHFFFKALGGGDDGLFAGLLTAHIVAASGVSLAGLIQPIGWPAITPDLRVPFTGNGREVLERIEASCGGTVTRLDGVRAQYATGWALARMSITEPLITLRFEGCDPASLREIANRFLAGVPELSSIVSQKIRSLDI